MHITILSCEVRWFGGKGIDLCPWGPSINSHKWHGLWSMVVRWLNIHCLPSHLGRLGGLPNNLNLAFTLA
jgi:hypothetical protein